MTASRQLYRARMLIVVALAAMVAAAAAVTLLRDDDTGVRHMAFSSLVYQSLDELATSSDLVVVGTVSGVAARAKDYRTADPNERTDYERAGITPIPIVFYEVAVSETLKGQHSDTVLIWRIDTEQVVIADGLTPLGSGQKVLLFLKGRSLEEASPRLQFPGTSSALDQTYYITLGLDNGVFDVSDSGTVESRMPERFTTGTVPTDLDGMRTQLQNAQPASS